jgi:pre-rRNA-processing protein TSR1
MSSHNSGKLKQSNKKHKKIGHASKRGVDRRLASGGRIVGNPNRNKARKKYPTKQTEGAGRANRLNRARQISAGRRKQMVLKRRFGAGAGGGAPKVLCIVGLSHNADQLSYATRQLILGTSSRTPHEAQKAPGFVSTMYTDRFRQRFSILTPPVGDTVAVLDAAKVCDVLVIVVEASTESNAYTSNIGIDTLCCLRAQGLPNVVGVQTNLSAIPAKQRSAAKKLGLRFFASELGEATKVVDIESSNVQASSALLCRILSETTSRELNFRRNRSYVVANQVEFVASTLDHGPVVQQGGGNQENSPVADLRISGYVRNTPLCVNSLVHLTGIGTYRLRRIERSEDPCPRKVKRSNNAASATMTSDHVLTVADLDRQDSLAQTAEPDQLLGEQSFISEAELREADERYDPATGGKLEEMSIHQAWIQAAREAIQQRQEYDGNDDETMGMFGDLSDDGSDEEDEVVLGALDGRGMPLGEASAALMGGAVGGASSTSNGGGMEGDMDLDAEDDDRNKSAAQVRQEATAMRQRRQEDDVKFPDEVDTPIDIPARIRFAKYRGLSSFRSSPWDPKESLPLDYSYVFQLSNYSMLQKIETTRADALCKALEKSRAGEMEDAKKRQKNKKITKKVPKKKNSSGNGMDVEDMDDDDNMSMMSTSSSAASELRLEAMRNLEDSAMPGSFVTLVLADVERSALNSHPQHSPLILSSLMSHENKMSVMHFLVQKSETTCTDTIQSKDALDICCGFRRTIGSRPIFSQHNFNSDKHKYERFLQPGRFTCASAYFPISYGQAPTLIMKTMQNGRKQLVASGYVRCLMYTILLVLLYFFYFFFLLTFFSFSILSGKQFCNYCRS